jgi:hypothetical protein
MDLSGGGGDPVNKRLMSCSGIFVSVDQCLQLVPPAFGAVEVDDLEPVRPRRNERLPTHRVERNALHVAAAPLVDDRHSASFHVTFEEKWLILLRNLRKRDGDVVRVAHQQAEDALCLLLARKLGSLFAFLPIPDPPDPFRGRDNFRPREHRAEEAVEGGYIHCILEAAVGKQKCVEFLDFPISQRSGFDQSHSPWAGREQGSDRGKNHDHGRNGIAATQKSLAFLRISEF